MRTTYQALNSFATKNWVKITSVMGLIMVHNILLFISNFLSKRPDDITFSLLFLLFQESTSFIKQHQI